MQRIDGRPIYSASDLNDFLECEHLTELERRASLGELVRPEADATTALLASKGEEHERRYFESLHAQHGAAMVAFDPPENTMDGLRRADAATREAMESGARIIYQPTFFDGQFLGRADFLRRVERPSARLGCNYEVIDTKLALHAKTYFLVQLCNYSEHVARITGTPPEYASIVLGSGSEQRFLLSDYAAYYRRLKRSFLERIGVLRETYPNVCAHCAICRWQTVCERQRDQDDHLSIVAWMRRDQIERLVAAGIGSVAALAHAPDEHRPHGMSESTFLNLRAQAALQHRQRLASAGNGARVRYFYEFRRPLAEGDGFYKLPPPASGDVFFDIEGDPLYRPDRKLEYLFGAYLPDERRYRAWWATDPLAERKAFEAFMDFCSRRREAYPQMHVYHYASYEPSALKRLAGQFASRGDLLDDFLRSGLFVDLFPVVRQSLRISQPSYSLKKVEAFYEMRRETETKGGDDSIVMFETWLSTRDDALLQDIQRYNDDDCRSTFALREWLLERREELNISLAQPIPWRAAINGEAPPEEPERTLLENRLLEGLPPIDSAEELSNAAETVRARWLLGHLLSYHRREAKPAWWKYFDRLANPNELEERDHEAIGGLAFAPEIPSYKVKQTDRNAVLTFRFPRQEHHLDRQPVDPHSGKGAGELIKVDDAARTLELKLNSAIPPESLRALIPGKPLPTNPQRAAIERAAQLYADDALGIKHPATSDLLLVRPPRLRDVPPNGIVQPADVGAGAISARIAALDSSALFVQGPPGSGKSTKGAHAIVDLLAAGKRVGILSTAHRAIHTLLGKVEATALERGVRFAGVHKSSKQTEDSRFCSKLAEPMVASSNERDALAGDEHQLASGTAFAWCDEALVGKYDYLFIDEAGQVSLADALGSSLAARNIVLLGDPLQLKQVSQASHPVGTERSILQHLLGDAETIDERHGIFLDVSYRMHPEICAFISESVYEGRLHADETTRGNRVDSMELAGSGLRFIPVAHQGCERKSPEEAAIVVARIKSLLSGTVAVNGFPPRAFTQDDALVVAPYNAQRRLISELLADAGLTGVRVGTVDKFQGQEAPVVFYSMATSSGDDMPRDMEFLFEKNRLNVAISRAQCASVLVCSPRLLEVRCNAPEQMALVNLLCAYAESTSA
ncbi:MAG: TM0106 family RecB-like putative nuclease [Candidatus Baltobacteraceae bacterium]